ncbi:TRAP transporter substrate-binding protein [Virgibacillus sp. W0430]|uniref:TRAP transporter substrate-binding protein n=1 Tax=Virgibacillus sp. W0430 TaxID=3391580 RepID=UPI003F464286
MSEMKKKMILFMITLGFIVLFISGCGNSNDTDKTSNDSEEVISFRLGQSKAATHPVSLGIDKFAELVKEKTNGEIVVETFHDGTIGDDREVIEGAQQGTLDFASSSTPNMASFTNYFIAWDLPYIFENKEEVYKAVDGKPGDVIREELEKSGFKVIFFPDYGFRQVVNNVRPIIEPNDLKGLKVRTTNSPVEQADFEAMGAVPTPMSWNEVYTGLQQGTIEAEGNSYSLLWSTKHQEVLKYATEVNYNYSSDIVVMNKAIFDNLSPEHQQIIMEAGQEAVEWQRDVANEQEAEAKQKFIDFGIEVYEPSDEEMKKWKQAVESVWDEFIVPGEAEPEYVEIILETLGKTQDDIFK